MKITNTISKHNKTNLQYTAKNVLHGEIGEVNLYTHSISHLFAQMTDHGN